ncbi:hypothetical protein AV530_011790 [Patagioenas fasciata monilis]|uniref:Uncharacterized protein n=1 Tax=Patagioenas fasciata monilis TaxID=372326 RepID=A0A1V4KLT3_PATFA|nr:hypothetical protein AV530_011790 [Patagioenas fasciata monilis]
MALSTTGFPASHAEGLQRGRFDLELQLGFWLSMEEKVQHPHNSSQQIWGSEEQIFVCIGYFQLSFCYEIQIVFWKYGGFDELQEKHRIYHFEKLCEASALGLDLL